MAMMWSVTQDVSSAALANIKEQNHNGHGRSTYHVSVSRSNGRQIQINSF